MARAPPLEGGPLSGVARPPCLSPRSTLRSEGEAWEPDPAEFLARCHDKILSHRNHGQDQRGVKSPNALYNSARVHALPDSYGTGQPMDWQRNCRDIDNGKPWEPEPGDHLEERCAGTRRNFVIEPVANPLKHRTSAQLGSLRCASPPAMSPRPDASATHSIPRSLSPRRRCGAGHELAVQEQLGNSRCSRQRPYMQRNVTTIDDIITRGDASGACSHRGVALASPLLSSDLPSTAARGLGCHGRSSSPSRLRPASPSQSSTPGRRRPTSQRCGSQLCAASLAPFTAASSLQHSSSSTSLAQALEENRRYDLSRPVLERLCDPRFYPEHHRARFLDDEGRSRSETSELDVELTGVWGDRDNSYIFRREIASGHLMQPNDYVTRSLSPMVSGRDAIEAHRSKWILVFRNNDQWHEGETMVVNNAIRTMGQLFRKLNELLHPPCTIMELFDVRMRRLTRVDELQDGERYLACNGQGPTRNMAELANFLSDCSLHGSAA